MGYYQLGLSGPNYPFLNFMFLACFAILAGCTYFLKSSFEKYENENLLLIDEISQRGRELLSANNIIETQRAELAEENIHLNKELIEKNNQLTETNHELIRHNNDLQQYSYTVSHNLRGPVASISGLLNLLDKDQLGESNKELIRYFQKATASLDTTIKDLSNIIDTRNEISRVNQKIEFHEIFYQVTALLQKEIKENDVQLITQFELASEVYSVKSMINSIFYNLISNAIKYRSPDRQPNITITTHREEPFVKIVVEDNGLGIDLEKYGHKIFGLYKRFHTHTEGKGLGLFLVKLQVESLGGKIEVRSKLGKGTQFSIHLKIPKNIEEQVLLEDESAKLFYQASLNALHVIWKKNTSIEEFEKVIQLSLDFLKVYLTPNWISDMRLSYNRDEDELNKVRAKYSDQLKRAGLARIAIIKPVDQENFNKNSFPEKVQDNYSAPIVFFDSRESAEEWIQQENKKQSQINLEFNHHDSRSS